MISRDYLSVKVWDLHMETKPIETYTVHEYLRSKLCSLYENDCIFDKFECCWNGNDTAIMTGSYNNFFRMFDRSSRKEVTYEASKEIAKPKTILKPRKVIHTIRKVKFLSKNSILTKLYNFLGKSKLSTTKTCKSPTFSRVFYPTYFWHFFSWNQSCQQLKKSQTAAFSRVLTQNNSTIFLGKSNLNFWTKNEDFEN